MDDSYRAWLGRLADSGNTEAQALLQVVGNDGGVDQGFLNQEYVDGQYNWTPPREISYNPEYGQIQGGDKWYGPEGTSRLNEKFYTDYQLVNQDDSGTQTSTSSGDGSTSLDQAAIDNTQKAISSLDTELDTGYGNIEDSFGSLMGKYDRERKREKGEYDQENVQNTKNLNRNKQNALLAAAQGRRGLRGTLASLGALSGDGTVLADRAVTTAANQDIGGAKDSYAQNAQTLDKAWGNFETEDEERRREAKTAKKNQRTALEGKVAGKRQSFFQKMAELFGDAGRTGEATEYLNKAGDLNETIAKKTAVAATPFNSKSAAFTPGDLSSYLAGAGDMTVRTSRGGAGNEGGRNTVLAGRGRRNREEDEDEELN